MEQVHKSFVVAQRHTALKPLHRKISASVIADIPQAFA
jgi:hypothetical protein